MKDPVSSIKKDKLQSERKYLQTTYQTTPSI